MTYQNFFFYRRGVGFSLACLGMLFMCLHSYGARHVGREGAAIEDDVLPPVVQSITLNDAPAATDTVLYYTVTFDETVHHVNLSDFIVTPVSGWAGGVVTSLSDSSGTEVVVEVAVIGSIEDSGTIRLDLRAETNITDDAGNGNGTNGYVAAFTEGDEHTVTLPYADTKMMHYYFTRADFDNEVFELLSTASGGVGIFIPNITSRYGESQECHLEVWMDPLNNVTFLDNETVTLNYTENLYTLNATTNVMDYNARLKGTITLTGSSTLSDGMVHSTVSGVSFGAMTQVETNVGTVNTASIVFKLNLIATSFVTQINAALAQDLYPAPPLRVTLSTNANAITNATTIPLTMSFTEPVTGFAEEDVVVTNGTLTNFATTDTQVFTADITPAAPGDVTMAIAADVAENDGGKGNEEATSLIITYDPIAPTVAISSFYAVATAVNPIPLTITFSKAVTGFEISDLTVTGGTASDLTGSDADYTVAITPSGNGTVTVALAADVATDAAGNGNEAAEIFSIVSNSTCTLTPGATTITRETQTIEYNTAPTAFTNVPTPTGGSGTIAYTWEASADSVTWATATGTATEAAYTAPALTADTYYRRRVQDTDGVCGTTFYDYAATVTILLTPEITVAGNTLTVDNGSTTPSEDNLTYFGEVVAGAGSLAHTFTIVNTGQATLTLTGDPLVAISGTDATDFSIVQPASATLTAGASETFEVTFVPTTTGSKTAVLTISSDDADANTYTFTLSGEGVTETVVFNEDEHTAITPNGDGNNDTWQIDGIESYPNNHVIIFNRWGQVVYKVSGYDNTNRVFSGQANQAIAGSNQLPDGSYFYLANLGNGTVKKGYLVIKH